jgi:hypothetical protein
MPEVRRIVPEIRGGHNGKEGNGVSCPYQGEHSARRREHSQVCLCYLVALAASGTALTR